MSLTEFSKDVKNHSKLPDRPTMTSQELKKLFDKAPEDIKEYINNVLTKELDNELSKKVDSKKGYGLISNDDLKKIGENEAKCKNIRNIAVGTSIPNTTINADIYIQYFN